MMLSLLKYYLPQSYPSSVVTSRPRRRRPCFQKVNLQRAKQFLVYLISLPLYHF